MTVLLTDRLELRLLTLDDAHEYWPLVADPDVLRFTGEPAMRTVDEVRALLAARPLRDYAVHGYGRLACIERGSGRLVGFSGLKYLEGLGETDIGYRFLPDCWGRGYATESARAVMEHAVQMPGIDRIVGLVEPENTASVRVLEKLGLVFEARMALPDHAGPVARYATRLSGRATMAAAPMPA